SQDDGEGLGKFADEKHIPIVQSGFTTSTKNNSHGEILREFVLSHPDCTHYLFLDADVCFLEPDTVLLMLEALEADATCSGIGPRMSWDGINEIPEDI